MRDFIRILNCPTNEGSSIFFKKSIFQVAVWSGDTEIIEIIDAIAR